MKITRLDVRRFLQLLAGLVSFGVGIGLMVRGRIGVPPWDVLGQGLVNVTGLNFGLVTLLIGVVILLLWIPLRERPGIGTVLNVLILGPVAQVILDIVPEELSLSLRIVLFISGLLLVALGTGLYLGASFGPGPRDGLMTGLHRVTRWPIWVVRTMLEVSVLIIGWLLGGNVGVGTAVFALAIGPLAQPAMRWFDLRPRMIALVARVVDDGDDPHPTSSSSTMERC